MIPSSLFQPPLSAITTIPNIIAHVLGGLAAQIPNSFYFLQNISSTKVVSTRLLCQSFDGLFESCPFPVNTGFARQKVARDALLKRESRSAAEFALIQDCPAKL
jgi:hypothetical protein